MQTMVFHVASCVRVPKQALDPQAATVASVNSYSYIEPLFYHVLVDIKGRGRVCMWDITSCPGWLTMHPEGQLRVGRAGRGGGGELPISWQWDHVHSTQVHVLQQPHNPQSGRGAAGNKLPVRNYLQKMCSTTIAKKKKRVTTAYSTARESSQCSWMETLLTQRFWTPCRARKRMSLTSWQTNTIQVGHWCWRPKENVAVIWWTAPWTCPTTFRSSGPFPLSPLPQWTSPPTSLCSRPPQVDHLKTNRAFSNHIFAAGNQDEFPSSPKHSWRYPEEIP